MLKIVRQLATSEKAIKLAVGLSFALLMFPSVWGISTIPRTLAYIDSMPSELRLFFLLSEVKPQQENLTLKGLPLTDRLRMLGGDGSKEEVLNSFNEKDLLAAKVLMKQRVIDRAGRIRNFVSQFFIGRCFNVFFAACSLASSIALFSYYSRHKELSEKRVRELNQELAVSNENLEKLSKTDPLTTTLNRRGLEQALLAEKERSKRRQTKLSAVFVDCDDFKKINEYLGYAGGDLMLVQVASVCKDSVRATDYVSRVGGDEFVMLLPDANEDEAFAIAERIRISIRDSVLEFDGRQMRGSVSMAVTDLSLGIFQLDEILTSSRAAIEACKLSGKNQVVLSSRV